MSASKSRSVKKGLEKTALPYATALVVCERVLVESDGVPSAIRIVDAMSVVPDRMPSLGEGIVFTELGLLFIVKAGEARGPRTFSLKLSTPEPVQHELLNWDFTFTDPAEGGQNLRFSPLSMIWAGEGVYYFDVLLGDDRLARTPFRLTFTPPIARR
jgi:hypothetical protein